MFVDDSVVKGDIVYTNDKSLLCIKAYISNISGSYAFYFVLNGNKNIIIKLYDDLLCRFSTLIRKYM